MCLVFATIITHIIPFPQLRTSQNVHHLAAYYYSVLNASLPHELPEERPRSSVIVTVHHARRQTNKFSAVIVSCTIYKCIQLGYAQPAQILFIIHKYAGCQKHDNLKRKIPHKLCLVNMQSKSEVKIECLVTKVWLYLSLSASP